jgi:transaldolase
MKDRRRKIRKMEKRSNLYEMSQKTPTVLWNDSSSIQELSDSIRINNAVGATCNPTIVLTVLKKEWETWRDRIPQIIVEMPTATEDEIGWRVTEEMSRNASKLLLPVFERDHGKNGRLSIQTNPKYYRNPQAILEQTERFNALAPNMIVKIPATAAGIVAIEEATYRGVSINATVSFCLPQAIAVAEAFERGLTRREKEKKDISTMGSVCTLMVGRLDDWLKVVMEKRGIIANPWVLDWAGVAVMKKAYKLYQQRGYRLRLLSAAFRNHLHWSEFIGGDVVISPPYDWQVKYNASDVTIENRMQIDVDPAVVEELERKFVDFRRSYYEDGMTVAEFDEYGPTRRTLRQFCKAVDDLGALVRDVMIPNPDV